VYPRLPDSLDCFSSSCVSYVANLSGLFFFVLCILCCQILWIVFLRLVYPMLPISLDCFSSSCVSYVASFSGLLEKLATQDTQDEEKQSTETGNIGYTRGKKTIQRNWQHRIHKTKKTISYVASFSGLFFFVLCILCCQFLWIVFLRLVYPMLPVSVDCFSSFCISYVASFLNCFSSSCLAT
jgi:hypothetical protein